jgi:hypothetical protein
MKTCEEVEISFHHSYLGTNGGEWSALCPSLFTTIEKADGTHWIGVWVVPRVSLDAVGYGQFSYPCRESNPDHPAP